MHSTDVHDEQALPTTPTTSDALPDDDDEVVGGPGVAMTHSMWRGTWVGGLAGGVGGAAVGAIVGLIWAAFNQSDHGARLVVICLVVFALAGAVIAFMLAGMAGAVSDADPEQAPDDAAASMTHSSMTH